MKNLVRLNNEKRRLRQKNVLNDLVRTSTMKNHTLIAPFMANESEV